MSEESATATVETPEPAESAPASLYDYARWAHAGPDAAFCEHGEDGQCENKAHWHAWCRIPNDFQEREIRDHALAAKARKIRQVRTVGTDGNEVLESSLEELRAEPDWKNLAASEIVAMDWAEDFLAASREVEQIEDPEFQPQEEDEDAPKLYAHIDDDRARLARLEAQDASERSEDEYKELDEHLKRHADDLQDAFDGIRNPKIQSYEAMPDDALLELLKRKRIEAQGRDEFLHARNAFIWLSCTYDNEDGELVFENLAALERASKSVLVALRETHSALMAQAQGALGN